MATDGKLVPSPGLSQADTAQSIETLRILCLNTPALARQRKSFVDTVRFLSSKIEIDEFLKTSPFRWSLRGL
jgi:hypothetical protein